MNSVGHSVSQRLSLREPQRQSLTILDRICDLIVLGKEIDPQQALAAIQSEFPQVTSFEDRDFVSLCFALATGVGKTRLMGAFVSYLHLARGVRHFFVLAPNLTIYNKLIQDFKPNTPKYVFQGIAAFATNPPEIITGDDYESGRGVRDERRRQMTLRPTDGSIGEDPIHINIFNISKINSEVRGGRSPRIKRLHEYIGESYFSYLSGLKDLVLLMDESHRYRGSAGIKAINELKPILGLELTATPQVENRLEDHLVAKLIDYDEISYDDNAELLYKLSGQAVAHLQSYLGNQREVENVLQHHREALAKLIHAQMEEHYEESATEYEVKVNGGNVTIHPRLVNVDANTAPRDFRQPVDDKSAMSGMVFGGFKRCLQSLCKFANDTERTFAVILEDERDGLKWFRPTRKDIRIWYKSGATDREYEPDFIVETADGKWICETKAAADMNDPEVQAKAKAATLWCKHAAEATGENWGYLLIPHDHVRMSMTFQGFVAGCRW